MSDLSLSILSTILLLLQVPATAILLSRLIKGAFRQPPIEPTTPTQEMYGAVTVVVPTLNERDRLSPCLAGLTHQSYEVREIIIVDSNSTDGTQGLVKAAAETDPRFRLVTDDPLPGDWVGRPWALNHGFLSSSSGSRWFLGIDADTQPHPGLVAAVVQAAEAEGYDLVSFSPQFILKDAGEMVLQPALLMTLVYRFGPTNTEASSAERVMANGQCFLCRRSVLAAVEGYRSARQSFCDDVTLARNIAQAGFKVGFMDGAKVIKVRMYEGAAETWREWGRSLDLKDAASWGQTWGDVWFLLAVQGLPLLVVLGYLLLGGEGSRLLLGLNLFLLGIRFALNLAIAPSYDRTQAPKMAAWLFWLSPLADPLAVLRIILSAIHTPTQWRGRQYGPQ
ncbi:2'-O-glycosyltransferase CruG [Oscillatoria acuminata]|uniref:Putative glycosyltransferase n=1 Tax=Oscillatoria acuminata PCC 6304 TaxID=56110 RepID=K9TKH1_9CYAN|nr:glycosyltransferase family 2 protein [Oscillatoria acuminata]AFY83040.1 putative glycosyltransferase [Oscillatoria acuminata PCC 6304]